MIWVYYNNNIISFRGTEQSVQYKTITEYKVNIKRKKNIHKIT